MRAILVFLLLVVPVNANVLNFSALGVLPFILDDGITLLSRIGITPSDVMIEGPRPDSVIVAPEINVVDNDQFIGLAFEATTISVVVSDYGYRIDFGSTVDVVLSPFSSIDAKISFDSDGIWSVQQEHSKYTGDLTSNLVANESLQDLDSGGPLVDGLALTGATYMEWRLREYIANTVPQNAGIGNINTVASAVPETASCGYLLFVALIMVRKRYESLRFNKCSPTGG